MTDDTTALPAADSEPTVVLPGVDATPTTSLRAPGRAGTTTLPDPRIAGYLAAAAEQLADLPPGERAELLEDLADHLAEIAADEGAAFGTRLGAPSEYAADFRASAGYPPLGTATGSAARPGWIRRSAHDANASFGNLRARIGELVSGLPGGPTLLGFLPRLRPAWWVFRAWLAALVFGVDWPTGTGGAGAFLWTVLFVVLSVVWGMRTERLGPRAPWAERMVLALLNGFAVLICLIGALGGGPLPSVTSQPGDYYQDSAAEAYPEQSGLSMGGAPITNLSAFDLAGNPIAGFQLFDQDGNPVVVDPDMEQGPDGESVYPVWATDSTGYPVNEAFPVSYVVANDYFDESTETFSLQVSRVLTPERVAPMSSITAPVVPPVGSVVPMDDNGDPDWANAQPPASTTQSPAPSEEASPTPTPSDETGTDKAAKDPAAPDKAAKDQDAKKKAKD